MTGPVHDAVDHPAHYTAHPSGIECIELTRMLPFAIGNAVKYIWRWELKNGIEDLRKARWYLRDAHQHRDLNRIPVKAWGLAQVIAREDTNRDRATLLTAVITGPLQFADQLLTHAIYMSGGPDA